MTITDTRRGLIVRLAGLFTAVAVAPGEPNRDPSGYRVSWEAERDPLDAPPDGAIVFDADVVEQVQLEFRRGCEEAGIDPDKDLLEYHDEAARESLTFDPGVATEA